MHLKNIFKGVQYKLSVISSLIFLLVLFIVTLLFFLTASSWTLFTGLVLGYLFSLIGFFLLYVSTTILVITWNKYWYLALLFTRLLIYLIPVIIFIATDGKYFNIFTIIVGIGLCSVASLLINIKVKKNNRRKGVEVSA